MNDMALTFRVQAEMAQAKAELQNGVAAFQKFGAAATKAMKDASMGGTAVANSFDALRASLDPAFAAQQRYRDLQEQVAGYVERGEASQMAANIVLEQARAKYLGMATAIDQAKAAQAEANAVTAAAAQEAAQLAARFTALRGSIDPAYAASMRFADAQRITQSAVAAGIATEAEGAAVLDALAAKMDMAGAASGRFAAAQTQAMGAARMNVAVTGNVAAQFNDIGVMMAAGQNPFMLAIQQGTQLSQVLNQVGGGAKGALAALKAGFLGLLNPTTLLTVGLIAGAAALVQWATGAGEAEGKADELKARIDELTTAIRELDTAQGAALEPLEKLREKYGQFAGAVRAARVEVAAMALETAKGGLSDVLAETSFGGTPVSSDDILNLDDLRAQIDEAHRLMEEAFRETGSTITPKVDVQALDMLVARVAMADRYVKAIGDEFDVSQDEARKLAEMLARVNAAATNEGRVTAARDLQAELLKVFGTWQAAEEATHGMYTSLSQIVLKSADLAAITGEISHVFVDVEERAGFVVARLNDAVAYADALAGVDIAGNINRALGPAAALAMRLWSAASAMSSFSDTQPALRGPAGMGDGDSAYATMRERKLAEQKAQAEAWRNSFGSGGAVSGGSSGGGRSTGGLADLSAQAREIMADLDLAIAAINEKVKAGLMTTAEAADAVSSAKAKAGDSVAELIAQIDRLGPAGAAAAEELRRQLPGLAADLNAEVSDLSKTLSEGFASPFKDFIKGTIDAGTAFQKFGDAVIDKLLDMAAEQAQAQFLQPLFDSIFGGMSFGAVPGHARGGEVIGIGTGTSDSNLRRLSHGEFVVNAKATAENRGLLQAINSGKSFGAVPGHARGGEVIGKGTGTSDSNLRRLSHGEFVVNAKATAENRGLLQAINSGKSIPMPRIVMPDISASLRMPDAPKDRGAAPVNVPVTIINNNPDARVSQSQRMQGGEMSLEIIVEKIQSGIAGDLARGVGPINDVMAGTFGLRRQGR